MVANERGGTARATRPRFAALAAFVALVVAGAAGCFLAPSPDDAWSADYGRSLADGSTSSSDAAVDALPPTRDAGACGKNAKACVDCCDSTLGLAAGTDYYAIVFRCTCPATTCSVCGVCGTTPELNDECVACLAENAGVQSSCTRDPLASRCGAGTPCHDYAACIAGCQP